MPVKFDRSQSVPQQVYELLRRKIMSVEFTPGASINERALVDALGVSRTPIREAIRRLSDEGSICIVPNVGTFVALIDPKRVTELCLIRSSMECAAIERTAATFSSALDRVLEELTNAQERTVDEGDMVRNIELDNQFHEAILAHSGYAEIQAIVKKAMAEIIRLRHLSIKLPGRLHEPIAEHREILAALRSGSASASSAAMRRHLDRSFASVIASMDANPNFLDPGDGRFRV